ANGPLGASAADPHLPTGLRGIDVGPGGGQPAAGRVLRPGLGRALPALSPDRTGGVDLQRLAGTAAAVPQLRRSLEALREAPGTPARRAGAAALRRKSLHVATSATIIRASAIMSGSIVAPRSEVCKGIAGEDVVCGCSLRFAA